MKDENLKYIEQINEMQKELFQLQNDVRELYRYIGYEAAHKDYVDNQINELKEGMQIQFGWKP